MKEKAKHLISGYFKAFSVNCKIHVPRKLISMHGSYVLSRGVELVMEFILCMPTRRDAFALELATIVDIITNKNKVLKPHNRNQTQTANI